MRVEILSDKIRITQFNDGSISITYYIKEEMYYALSVKLFRDTNRPFYYDYGLPGNLARAIQVLQEIQALEKQIINFIQM